VTQSTPPARTDSSKLPPFDPNVPNPARMWNYWLGGKDNFAADRELAERVLKAMPSMPLIARAARLFLIDAAPPTPSTHPSGRCPAHRGPALHRFEGRRVRAFARVPAAIEAEPPVQ
jgi:hypothetical protein